MSVDAIQFLAPPSEIGLNGVVNTAEVKTDFASWLKQEVAEVNNQIIESDNQLRQLAIGEADNLHQVMISLEKAKTMFELTVQVRNKLLEGYQDIMRMQI